MKTFFIFAVTAIISNSINYLALAETNNIQSPNAPIVAQKILPSDMSSNTLDPNIASGGTLGSSIVPTLTFDQLSQDVKQEIALYMQAKADLFQKLSPEAKNGLKLWYYHNNSMTKPHNEVKP